MEEHGQPDKSWEAVTAYALLCMESKFLTHKPHQVALPWTVIWPEEATNLELEAIFPSVELFKDSLVSPLLGRSARALQAKTVTPRLARLTTDTAHQTYPIKDCVLLVVIAVTTTAYTVNVKLEKLVKGPQLGTAGNQPV